MIVYMSCPAEYHQRFLIFGLNIDSINLRIEEGSFVGIVGQVGSGKSTLLSAILGETEKINGSVAIKVFTATLNLLRFDSNVQYRKLNQKKILFKN